MTKTKKQDKTERMTTATENYSIARSSLFGLNYMRANALHAYPTTALLLETFLFSFRGRAACELRLETYRPKHVSRSLSDASASTSNTSLTPWACRWGTFNSSNDSTTTEQTSFRVVSDKAVAIFLDVTTVQQNSVRARTLS